MPTLTATTALSRTPYYFLFKRLHSLTGILFGGYLVFHLLINATIMQMGTVFQDQVDQIHRLPFLNAIEWIFIFIPLIYHVLFGIYIIVTGQPNVGHYSYPRNWIYFLQRVSAVIIVLFVIFHVVAIRYGWFGPKLSFDPHNASATVHRHMTAYWWVASIVYPVGIVASCYHLAAGFWAAAITWGLTVSAGAQRRFGYVCAVIFLVTLSFGLIALVASLNPKLDPTRPIAESPSDSPAALLAIEQGSAH